jgi:hypothetical protein
MTHASSHLSAPHDTAPAARVPIVQMERDGRTTGLMARRFQRWVQRLTEVADRTLFAGAIEAGADSFIYDNIGAGRSLIRVEFDLVPATDNVSLYLLARTGSGVDVTAYSWSLTYNDSGTTAAGVEDTSDTQIVLAGGVQSDASTGGISGAFTIFNIQSSRYKRATGLATNFDNARERVSALAGRIDTASAVTGFKLIFSSGAIASGYARVEAP